MVVSRRVFLQAAAAAGLATGLALGEAPARAASAPGDVVGKVTVGYQGWFACPGDGAPINGWWHWARNWGAAPSPANSAKIGRAHV